MNITYFRNLLLLLSRVSLFLFLLVFSVEAAERGVFRGIHEFPKRALEDKLKQYIKQRSNNPLNYFDSGSEIIVVTSRGDFQQSNLGEDKQLHKIIVDAYNNLILNKSLRRAIKFYQFYQVVNRQSNNEKAKELFDKIEPVEHVVPMRLDTYVDSKGGFCQWWVLLSLQLGFELGDSLNSGALNGSEAIEAFQNWKFAAYSDGKVHYTKTGLRSADIKDSNKKGRMSPVKKNTVENTGWQKPNESELISQNEHFFMLQKIIKKENVKRSMMSLLETAGWDVLPDVKKTSFPFRFPNILESLNEYLPHELKRFFAVHIRKEQHYQNSRKDIRYDPPVFSMTKSSP